jgi:O-antigen/teichoic acid export membrane protein
MKQRISQLKRHPSYDKALHWGKLISITGSAQVVVQAVGFICGILIIRLLPVHEYALYTLVNTMLGTISILADGGISSGVMAQGAKVWDDKEKLGIVLATGLDLRKKFAIGSLLVSVPILFYLLLHNGASWIVALLIATSMIPAFFAALSDSLLEIVPKLHQSILPLQKNQVEVSLWRLLLLGITMFLFPWAFVAVLASGIARIYGNIKLRKIVYSFADKKQEPHIEVQKEILTMVKHILPGSIYYCFSSQITVWLISIFGDTISVAQLGALGRLSMLLSLFSVLISTLIIPRFARLASEKKILLKRFLQTMSILTFFLFLIVAIVYFFPKPILWLLGNAYAELQHELVLSIIGSCISLMGGIAFSLYTSRGWVLNPLILIGVNLSSIIVLSLMVNLSSLSGILMLNVGIAFIGFVLNGIYCLNKILKINLI